MHKYQNHKKNFLSNHAIIKNKVKNIKEKMFYYLDIRSWSPNNNNYYQNLARSKKCMAFIQIMQSSKNIVSYKNQKLLYSYFKFKQHCRQKLQKRYFGNEFRILQMISDISIVKISVSKNKLGHYMKFDLSIFFLQTNSFNFRVDKNILILKYIIFKLISEVFAIMINKLIHIKNQSSIELHHICFMFSWMATPFCKIKVTA